MTRGKGRLRRSLSLCAAVLLVLATMSIVLGTSNVRRAEAATLGTPFTCTTPTVFNASGTPTTQLFAQSQAAAGASFTPIGPASTVSYNAIGFDPLNNFIYGITGVQLVAVDSTGAVTNLGTVAGLPATGSYLSGAFDPAGNYYVMDSNTGNIYLVNVTTLTATFVMTSAFVRMFDFTWANGFLWGLNTSTAGVVTMVRIDVVNKVVSSFSTAGLALPNQFYGAAWTYGNGNLGFDGNGGGLFQIAVTNPSSASPTFSVVATAAGPASNNNDGTACSPGPVDLAIAKAGPSVIAPSGTITWTLTVTNNGPNVSSGYVVTDAVPSGYTVVASATPGCTVTGNNVSCIGGILAVGSTATITMTAKAPAIAGCLTNTASVTGNESDPVSLNNTSSLQTCVPANPSISVAKTASPSTVTAAGQQVTYTFVVTNTGNSPLTAVNVTDAFTSGGAGTLSTITCQSLAAPAGSCSGTSTSLQVGQQATFTATYTVSQGDVDGRTVGNTATATGTPPSGPNVTATSSATVTATQTPALRLSKSVSPTSVAGAGSTVTYSFVVTNTGNVTMSNIAVADSGVAGTSFSGTGTLSAITCPSTTLVPGAAVTCTATYTVTQADLDNGSLHDSAIASGTTPSGGAEDSLAATATVAVDQAPRLSIVKSTDTGGITEVGEQITYTFLVTNSGNVMATDVRVVDKLPGLSMIECPQTTLAAGLSMVCTATYQVTQTDLDLGGVSNTAVATGATPNGGSPITSPASSVFVPSAVTTTNLPPPTSVPSGSAQPPAAPAPPPELAFTGTAAVQLSVFGLVLVLVGGVVTLVGLRRRRPTR